MKLNKSKIYIDCGPKIIEWQNKGKDKLLEDIDYEKINFRKTN